MTLTEERTHFRLLALDRASDALEEEAGIRVRQPLSRLVCVVPHNAAGDSLAIKIANESRTLDPEDLVNVRPVSGTLPVTEEEGRFAAIDPAITPALRREEIARELVSQVQRLRRDLTFAASDRIRLWIVAPDDVQAAIAAHDDWVANELLAWEIVFGDPPVDHQATHEMDLDGSVVRIALTQEQ